ncbi:hypothetical protein HKX48_006869 [Thoreauomyces humboldtii]|nr:hypothetical protein HKX48_006869 [Thoreauomyces humboldtii]
MAALYMYRQHSPDNSDAECHRPPGWSGKDDRRHHYLAPRIADIPLRKLTLSGNALSGRSAQLAASMLGGCLQELRLVDCGLGPAGMVVVAKVLSGTRGLRVLDVADNRCGPKPLTWIVNAHAKTLEDVNLGSNRIEGRGVAQLCDALGRCRLLRLSLEDSTWGGVEEVKLLAAGFRPKGNWRGLERINLQSCSFDCLSLSLLLAMMENGGLTDLVHLRLANNDFDGKALIRMSKLVRSNPKLEIISLTRADFAEEEEDGEEEAEEDEEEGEEEDEEDEEKEVKKEEVKEEVDEKLGGGGRKEEDAEEDEEARSNRRFQIAITVVHDTLKEIGLQNSVLQIETEHDDEDDNETAGNV